MLELKVLQALTNQARYSAIWGEVNTRIFVRASINTAHFTIILTIAGLILSSSGKPDATIQGFLFGTSHFSISMFVLSSLLPLVSTVFVLWYIQHDRAIGILGAILQEIEIQSLDATKANILPAVQSTPQGWMALLHQYRDFGDLAMSIVCLVSPANVLLIFFPHLLANLARPGLDLFGKLALVVICLCLTWFNLHFLGTVRAYRGDALKFKFDRKTLMASNTSWNAEKEIAEVTIEEPIVILVHKFLSKLIFPLIPISLALYAVAIIAFYQWNLQR